MCSKALKFLSGSKVLATGFLVLWTTGETRDGVWAWAVTPNCLNLPSSFFLNSWLYVGKSFGGWNPVGGGCFGLELTSSESACRRSLVLSRSGNSSDAGSEVGSRAFVLMWGGRIWLEASVSSSSYFLSAFFVGIITLFCECANWFCYWKKRKKIVLS